MVVFEGSLVFKIASSGQWIVFRGSLVHEIVSLDPGIEVVLRLFKLWKICFSMLSLGGSLVNKIASWG